MSRKDNKKKELVYLIARELYQFNFENPKWQVKDEFEVDGKKYFIKGTVYDWLGKNGYDALVRLLNNVKKKRR